MTTPSGPGFVPEAFEVQAAEFYYDTGMMAPGKDQPAAMGGPEIEVRQAAWRVWCTLRAELGALRTRLEEAERDSKRLEQLQSMILPDDPLHEGDVTLNAFTYACNEGMPDEFRAPCVQIYLGEHPIPTGIGDTLRAAIDHAATPSKEQDHE